MEKIKNRREIYKLLYNFMKKEFSNPSKYWLRYNQNLTIQDNASRMANIYAVQNTEKAYQSQFSKKSEIAFIIFDEIKDLL